MSAYALEKTNIPQRDSPPPKTWHTRYELPDEYPKTVQFDQKTPIPQKTTFIEPKTQFTQAQNELPSCDGIPMETERHKLQMDLLINSLKPFIGKRGYVSGNMFVYFSPNQVKNEDFRGPDVFVALGRSNHERKSWVVWEEGKSPDIVIELLSESTAKEDKGKKKQIYQDKLGVQEYYWFDPHNPEDFKGFFLKPLKESQVKVYEPLVPDAQNRLVSGSLGLALTRWYGVYEGVTATWLRWETSTGELLPTPQELRDIETQRANAAEQHAKVAFSEGEQQGEQKKALETARKMLAKGFDLAEIAELTGLSLDELATLK